MVARHEAEIKRLELEHNEFSESNKRMSGIIDALAGNIERLNREVAALEKELKRVTDENAQKHAALLNQDNRIKELIAGMQSSDRTMNESIEKLEKVSDEIRDLETRVMKETVQIDGIKDYLLDNYDYAPEEFEDLFVEKKMAQEQELRDTLKAVKAKISELGYVNPMAIQEFEITKERYDFQLGQKNDLLTARRDLEQVIADVDRESVEIFKKVFATIKNNFHHIFRRLFLGGSADISLIDDGNILESGINITVQPPGKKVKNISQLSGGEKTMTAIALLFATYMVKASPFYLLDEIDAALDDTNIGRFLNVLKDYQETQFLIITHNRNTMEASQTMYGIVMHHPGISEVLSVKFGDKKLVNEEEYSRIISIQDSGQLRKTSAQEETDDA